MKYSEARKEVFNRPWKVSTCNSGESCWCRMIELVEPVEYQVTTKEDDEVRFHTISEVVPMGALDADVAMYMVALHNDFLEKKSQPFEAFND
jgi:hypothetical protein